MSLTKKEKQYLLKLARESIEYYLDSGSMLNIGEKDKKEMLKDIGKEGEKKLKEMKGCFVTLTMHTALRGCIGHLLPIQPLYKDVIENAVNAAFKDPRFPPMVKKELEDIHIEISVLEIPKKLNYKDEKDLVEKLTKAKPGVILKKGFHQATFLPQVWEDLPNPEEFLTHLSMKAGLPPFEWKKGADSITIEVYGVEKFEENE